MYHRTIPQRVMTGRYITHRTTTKNFLVLPIDSLQCLVYITSMSIRTYSLEQGLQDKLKALSEETDIPMSRLLKRALLDLFEKLDANKKKKEAAV